MDDLGIELLHFAVKSKLRFCGHTSTTGLALVQALLDAKHFAGAPVVAVAYTAFTTEDPGSQRSPPK